MNHMPTCVFVCWNVRPTNVPLPSCVHPTHSYMPLPLWPLLYNSKTLKSLKPENLGQMSSDFRNRHLQKAKPVIPNQLGHFMLCHPCHPSTCLTDLTGHEVVIRGDQRRFLILVEHSHVNHNALAGQECYLPRVFCGLWFSIPSNVIRVALILLCLYCMTCCQEALQDCLQVSDHRSFSSYVTSSLHACPFLLVSCWKQCYLTPKPLNKVG